MESLHKTILIVEDEAIPAFVLKKKLSKWGFSVVGLASDGLTAIKIAAQDSPDIILMDINLNGDMDGIDAAKEIQLSSNPTIIFLTGYNNHGYRERAMELNPQAYLQKPVDMDELQQVVCAV